MTINSPFAYPVPFATMTDLVASPDAAARTETAAEVTPAGVIAARIEMANRFDPELIRVIARLIEPTGITNDDVIVGIETLFVTHWKVKSWSDLRVFRAAAVDKAIFTSGLKVPDVMTEPVVCEKLKYVVDYARVGKLTPGITMDDIVDYVTDAATRSSTKKAPRNDSPPSRTVQVIDKKAVPTLEKFSGLDEDYFAWRELTVNTLGAACLGRLLDDKTMSGKYPEVAEAVFYALRGAVYGGQAQSIAQTMLDEKNYDPTDLWEGLENYYNTALNRANVVLFDIKRLFNIRLDPDTTATKFISDFRDCLQRLRKNKATIAGDDASLRALLLVAIQDDDFEVVRDSIVKDPNRKAEAILTDLREREMSLKMKDDNGSNLKGDGNQNTRYTRRSQSANNQTQSRSRSGTQDLKSAKDGSVSNTSPWKIPRFPDSWKNAFGHSLFGLLLEWRSAACRGKSQGQLNSEYDTVVEKFRRDNPRHKSQTRSSRRTSNSPASTSTTQSSSTTL